MENYECRFCRSKINHVFVDLGISPLSNAFLTEENLECLEKTFPLKVFVCENCFLVQLTEFEHRIGKFFHRSKQCLLLHVTCIWTWTWTCWLVLFFSSVLPVDVSHTVLDWIIWFSRVPENPRVFEDNRTKNEIWKKQILLDSPANMIGFFRFLFPCDYFPLGTVTP